MAKSALRFTRTAAELRELTAHLVGEWRTLNENQKQFRGAEGGILNWFPSTGTINFQGKAPARDRLEQAVRHALGVSSDTPVSERRPTEPGTSKHETRVPAASRSFFPAGDSELVLGLICAVGTQLDDVRRIIKDRLKVCGYSVVEIRITKDVLPAICDLQDVGELDENARLTRLMDAGNEVRAKSEDNSILALGAAATIAFQRRSEEGSAPTPSPKTAYIISSLKHPEEVDRLRQLYPQGFHLIGVHADEKRRYRYLTDDKNIAPDDAQELMRRDENENLHYGQRVADAFHMSDFFVRLDGDGDLLKYSLWRVLDLLFGHPFVTPTFDEFAMFMAFSASLRSADLSRQVGAVVALQDQVVATGANDCPKFGGGLYWPKLDPETKKIEDQPDGRDYRRGEDSNKVEQAKIIDEIVGSLVKKGIDADLVRETVAKTQVGDLTEYGRVVHAEMEALLGCARARISPVGGTLYTTTFPCHNCAKHIVAAGIHRVVFVEPYHKSKAIEFHSDSVELGFDSDVRGPSAVKAVKFEPFVGVGPRRFFDLFSMRLGSGYRIRRKDADGYAVDWEPATSQLRLEMLPHSYLDLEVWASNLFQQGQEKVRGNSDDPES